MTTDETTTDPFDRTASEREAERAQAAAVKLCVEACQRIAQDFSDGSFDGVTFGAIEDAVAAAQKLNAAKAPSTQYDD